VISARHPPLLDEIEKPQFILLRIGAANCVVVSANLPPHGTNSSFTGGDKNDHFLARQAATNGQLRRRTRFAASVPLTRVPVMGTIDPIMGTVTMSGSVSQGLFGQTRTAILSLLYGHADESFYVRQLVRETGAGNGAIQREVRLLTDAGLIVRRAVGRQIYYQANRKSPVFSELRGLVLKTSGVHDVLRAALAPLRDRIKIAFVYGSIAGQKDRADSDVDLMIVGDADLVDIVSRLSSAQKRLRREINPAIYPLPEFRSKLHSGNHFLNSVMRSKKVFIFGSEDELRKLSAKRMAKRP